MHCNVRYERDERVSETPCGQHSRAKVWLVFPPIKQLALCAKSTKLLLSRSRGCMAVQDTLGCRASSLGAACSTAGDASAFRPCDTVKGSLKLCSPLTEGLQRKCLGVNGQQPMLTTVDERQRADHSTCQPYACYVCQRVSSGG